VSEKMRASKYFQALTRNFGGENFFRRCQPVKNKPEKTALPLSSPALLLRSFPTGESDPHHGEHDFLKKNPRLSDRSSAPIKQNKHELRRP
jgi:hypothetical protein